MRGAGPCLGLPNSAPHNSGSPSCARRRNSIRAKPSGQAFEVIERVKSRLPVIRFSDENVSVSTHAAAVLKPFAALHLGAAVAHPAIDTLATYDAELARAAELYQLAVVSPGLPAGWHNGVAGSTPA